MTENILELLKNQLTGPILGQIAQSLGLSEDKARSGLEGVIASVLSGLLQKVSRPGGPESLLKTVRDEGFSGEMLNNLGSLLGTADGAQSLMKTGGSLLEGLFGDKLGNLATTLSSGLGVPKGAVNSLLALVTPLVMGQLGKLISAKGLNASGLADLLLGQKSSLMAAAPPGLSSALGLNSLADLGKDMQRRAAAVGSAATQTGQAALEGMNWSKWVIPACLLAALLAALGLYASRPREAPVPAGAPAAPEVARATVENAAERGAGAVERAGEAIAAETRAAATGIKQEIAGAAAGAKDTVARTAGEIKAKLTALTLPGGVKLELPENSGLAHLAGFLGSPKPGLLPTFPLESFQYDPATTTVSAAGLESMDILAKILKAFPGVNIKLIGHADTISDSDQQKAQGLRRASDARTLLVERGIDAGRIDVEGAETEAKGSKLELTVTKL
jgi:outer membrane protein OmpA-like peptidoglycan-associated protein